VESTHFAVRVNKSIKNEYGNIARCATREIKIGHFKATESGAEICATNGHRFVRIRSRGVVCYSININY